MSSVIKVNACVYSRIGYGREKNTSSFYMNGKFISENHIENVQASMVNRGSDYLFVVADNMACEVADQDMNVSILKEVGRVHEKFAVNGGDIYSNAKDLESRVNDTERLLSSFLEMNNTPLTDTRWNLGFSGLLMQDGQFVALTGGNAHVYMMRDGMFRSLANETTKAKRAIDARINAEQIQDEVEIPGEENNGSVIVSDLYDLQAGDSFILISDAVIEALGEEKIEDLIALRSGSDYIAYRLVDEAMKRKFSGDLTAMVVQVEKVYNNQGGAKKQVSRNQPKPTAKKRVDKLNKVPPVTYKYSRNKRRSSKHQGAIYLFITILTIVVAFSLLFLIIDSLIDTGMNNIDDPNPTQSATTSPTETPTYNGDTQQPDEPTVTPDPVETTPTGQPDKITEHIVKSGESINSIARKYYGDISLVEKLCLYNDISDPNLIKVDQVIKIPSKEVLTQQ